MDGRIESNQGDLLHTAALAGLGIVRYSLWHASADLRAGRLHMVLPGYRFRDTGIHAVPPRVGAFVDFLSGQWGETPPWERA